MHCPKCGLQIESDEISFCSRCGLTLGLIRAAITDGEPSESGIEVRRSSVNLGVILMFVGTIPAILTILFLNTSTALPLSVLMLITAYLGILLGSGPLITAFRRDETWFSELVPRDMRKEIALGSTLMLIGIVLAICLVALLPGAWEKLGFITFPLAALVLTLLSSGWIKNSVWEIVGGDPAKSPSLPKAAATESLQTGELGRFQIGGGSDFAATDLRPSSVTEGTTRLLKDER